MKKIAFALALTGAVGLAGCETADQDTARRGATGAAAGAVIGGVIGSFSGNWGAGAAAGAAIGGTSGVLYDQVRKDRAR
jgi:uncharacterized membrane protein